MMDTETQGGMTMAADLTKSCLKDPDMFVGLMVSASSHRNIMIQIYSVHVRQKELTMMELQADEVKRHYWGQAKKLANGRLVTENLKKLAKALYLLDHLLKPHITNGNTTEEG